MEKKISGLSDRKNRKGFRRSVACLLVLAILFTCPGLENLVQAAAAAGARTTIYLKDDTQEHWLGNDNAVIEMVDNTSGHTHYIMKKENSTTWSARVPAATFNVTFNRLSPDGQTQWNSWSAGGRGSNRDDMSTWSSTYHATVPEHGYWDGTPEYMECFHEGDVIYLDYYPFPAWENAGARFYVNFTDASKADNHGADIAISSADREEYSPVPLSAEIEEQVFTYTLTAQDEGATALRFWRGNDSTLWNDTVELKYTDYKAGNNCVKVQGWDNTGYVCPYVPRRHVPAITSTKLEVSGNKKVNRKVTVNLDIQGETQYLNLEDTRISIEKLDSTGNAIPNLSEADYLAYDSDATAWNHRELLFKESGTYRISTATLSADGTDTCEAEEIISIAPDNAPVAGLKLTDAGDEENNDESGNGNEEEKENIFVRNKEGKLSLKAEDRSVSELNDEITQRVYTIYHDADNDGEFSENEIIRTISGNETEFNLSLDKVGNYRIVLNIRESFTDTIPALLTEEDCLTGQTSISFEIVNQAPVSSMSIKKSRIADIIFTVGNVNSALLAQYAAITEGVRDRLDSLGMEANVSTVSTSVFTSRDTFAWREYDHYNYQEFYFPWLEKHILCDDRDIQMLGYYSDSVKDFLYVEDHDCNKKIFEFDLKRDDTDWHSMEGGGFLFNTDVSDEENYIQGYCILVTRNGLELVQIDRTDLDWFRTGTSQQLQGFGRLLQCYEIGDVYADHHFKIVTENNILTVYDGEQAVINEYVLPDDGVQEYGYGPITSHIAHYCKQMSYFTFRNITMRTITGESLSDVVNNHEWTPGENHYVINFSETSVPELSDNDRMSDVAAALLSSNAAFYGIGNENTISQYNALLNSIDGKGENIRLAGASGSDGEEGVTIDMAVEHIVSQIISDINSRDYGIGPVISSDEKVEYTGTYCDPEGDEKGEEIWNYVYDGTVFGEGADREAQTLTLPEPITMFVNTGAYTITHKVRDNPAGDNDALTGYSLWSDEDDYEKLILSQHRPVAGIAVNMSQSQEDSSTCMVNVRYSSYDEDHPQDSSKGIRGEEFYYKQLGDTEWTKGRFPASVAMGTTYLIKYIVTDIEGTKSRPRVVAVKTNEAREYVRPEDDNPPAVSLTVSDRTVQAGEKFYVEAGAQDDYGVADFCITMSSSATDDGAANGTEIARTYGRFECVAQEAGEYVITATATDIAGNRATQTATVMVIDSSDVTPPAIDILSPENGVLSGDTDIIGTIKDDKRLKSYTVTRTGPAAEDGDYNGSGGAGMENEENTPVVIAGGTEEIINGTIAAIKTGELPDGLYRYEIKAEDMAGNVTTASRMLTVIKEECDAVPPQAAISDIVPDKENSAITVYGSVSDETGLSGYELYLNNSGGAGTEQLIGTGSSEVNEGILGVIDTDSLSNGDYTLRLTAADLSGNTCESMAGFTYNRGTSDRDEDINVNQDLTAPVIMADVKAVIENGKLKLHITGTIEDENLAAYDVITGKPGSDGELRGGICIASGTSPVTDACIADYTYPSYETGAYAVHISASDEAGNTRTVKYVITINDKGMIDRGYDGEEEDEEADRDSLLKLTLSKNIADTGDSVNAYMTYPQSATDITLTAEGADVSLSGRTAAITSAHAGEIEVVLRAVIDGREKSVTKSIRFFDTSDKTHPVVEFITPEADSDLNTRTDIYANIYDETGLAYYTLEYRMEGEGCEYKEIARGTEALRNEKAGGLDTTMLMNGSYVLRITAVDNGGNRAWAERKVNVTGNLKVGNMALGFTDIHSNVAGLPLAVNRNYDSRNKSSGDFGCGWTMGIQSAGITGSSSITDGYRLVQTGSGFSTGYYLEQTMCHDVTVTYGDGTSDKFELKLTPERSALIPIYEVEVTFRCVTDKRVKLEPAGDSHALVSGGQLIFGDDMFEKHDYILTRPDGTKLYLNTEYGLTGMEDANGNTVSITKSGYRHSSGNSVVFTRDDKGRITRAEERDSDGETITAVTYAYDSRGDLIAVTDNADRTVAFTYDNDHNLIDIIDPSGIAVARNIYDEDGRLAATVDADGNRTEYEHDLDARMEAVRDKLGNATVYYYDDNGNVLKKVDALGNVTYASYDDDNNLLTETDALGNVTSYTYDENGNVTSKILPDGTVQGSTYTQENRVSTVKLGDTIIGVADYDAKGCISRVEDANGDEVSYEYINGKVASITDNIGVYQKFTYDSNGNVVSSTNGNNEVTKYSYDKKGNVTGTERRITRDGETKIVTTNYSYDDYGNIIQSTDSEGNVMSYVYDANGNNIKATDSKNRSIYYEYDNLGNMIKITYPDHSTETFSYDANGNNITATDRNGNTCNMTYDALNRPVKKEYTSGGWERYVYDAAGNLIQLCNSSGADTKYKYNSRGLNTEVTDTFGAVTKYEYDAAARLISRTDALGNVTSYTYDGAGNETQVTYPDGTNVKMAYDCRSRLVSFEDAYGNKTRYEYDNSDRLTKVRDALQNSYEYSYNESGNLVGITDPLGNTTKYTYDTAGNVLSIENALGNRQTYTYSENGNVSAYKDYNGNITTFTYDDLGRCISKISEDGTVNYTYENDLLVSASENQCTTLYAYDDYGRLIRKTDVNGNVIEYTYDSESRISKVSVNNKTTSYQYDELDRIVRVTDHNGQATVYEYDSVGNRRKAVYANGTVLMYTYDACQRLKEECLSDAQGNELAKYSYTYGKAGEKLSTTEKDENGNITEINYAYDELLRLTKETINNNGSRLVNEYTYDSVSNRTKKVTEITGNPSDVIKVAENETAGKGTGDSYFPDMTEGTTRYTYNAVYQLTKEEREQGITVYEYDGNGNLLRQSGLKNAEYQYDAANQLVSAETYEDGQSSKESYAYDCSGNRVSKTAGGITTIYITDSSSGFAEVVGEIEKNESSEKVSSEVYTLNGTERINVVKYTGDGTAQSERFYLTDSHGDVRGLTDAAGNITDKYSYDAYGNILKASGSTENEFLYTGEQYNESTKLYYLRARYMDPDTGRFTGADSYQGDKHDPVSLHKYLYANANPITYTDPSGNMAAMLAGMAINSEVRKIEAAYDEWCIKAGMGVMAAIAAYKTVNLANSVAYDLQWLLVSGEISLDLNFASYVTAQLLETTLPAVLYITVTPEMRAVQVAVEKLSIEGKYWDHSVYLLRQRSDGKVMYVGITSQKPEKRMRQHKNDKLPVNQRHPKKTGGEYWVMQVIFTGLTKEAARLIEQSLICIYTIDALSNARYEISVGKIDEFNSELKRAASLLKVDEAGLMNLVKRKEWSGE